MKVSLSYLKKISHMSGAGALPAGGLGLLHALSGPKAFVQLENRLSIRGAINPLENAKDDEKDDDGRRTLTDGLYVLCSKGARFICCV